MLLAAAVILPQLINAPPPGAVKLPRPGVQYKINQASASSRPWVNANGWRLERGGDRPFFYDVQGATAALAAAEAFTYRRDAGIHADAPGTAFFARMLAFLKALTPGPAAPLANMCVVDDGSSQTGEVMNLLARHNLLYRVTTAPDRNLPLNIQLGTPLYPLASALNPETFAQQIRRQLTDEKRLIRIYGSDVVIGKLYGDSGRVRLHLINYSDRPIYGLRVRVLGVYPIISASAFDEKAVLQDFLAGSDATEFTLPELKRYAVVDLASK